MVNENELSPAIGAQIEYDGHIGEIRFICSEYLTMCIREKDTHMIGDCCMLIYKCDWQNIKILKSTHRQ